MREEGGWAVRICLIVDALSVYAAVTASQVKVPADCSLLAHVQYVGELLDFGILHSMIWFDTRDMIADGLTKGAVEREALRDAMAGQFTLKHDLKAWHSPLAKVHARARLNNHIESPLGDSGTTKSIESPLGDSGAIRGTPRGH